MCAAGIAPFASLLDLCRCVIKPQPQAQASLLAFNPYLTEQSCCRLLEGICTWMQLCVLEDRLERVSSFLQAPEDMEPLLVRVSKREVNTLRIGIHRWLLVQELRVWRSWAASDHLSWLAFEVEGQLQIRPTQYVVVEHLINHPGDIIQLNMGEGKTRVILPMLLEHWSSKGSHVVRYWQRGRSRTPHSPTPPFCRSGSTSCRLLWTKHMLTCSASCAHRF